VFLFTFWREQSRKGSPSGERLAGLRKVLNKVSGPTNRQPLCFPLKAPTRIAVLCGDFSLPAGAREVSATDTVELACYKPDALVAPLDAVLRLADYKLTGQLSLPSLSIAIAVLTRLESPLLDTHRDLLWLAFGLPVFEILQDSNGTVLARECEVHDGLHFEPASSDLFAGDEVTRGHCDCGVETPRVTKRYCVTERYRGTLETPPTVTTTGCLPSAAFTGTV
jgi:hypothetical protein